MRLLLLPLFALGLGTFALAQEEKDRLAPYYPTPETVVDKMLQLGELKAGEVMYDLGSGDGRIVVMAARKFKAKANGVEFDADLVKLSQERLKTLGLDKTAKIIHGDALAQDYSNAQLLTIYLLPSSINDKVRPILEKQLKKGTRVVCHDFEVAGWTPEKTVAIDDDGEGRAHTLYLYRR
jgi:16S rRNA A1518/A1519 N6-dimethyltransferase RsmA/KsgA/DIM1 with predicted DNA glycosylase/AP lyase activity